MTSRFVNFNFLAMTSLIIMPFIFYFYGHSCSDTTVFLYEQNMSDDHPVVRILHGLETTAYGIDNIPRALYYLGFLRWVNMLNCRLKYILWFFLTRLSSSVAVSLFPA